MIDLHEREERMNRLTVPAKQLTGSTPLLQALEADSYDRHNLRTLLNMFLWSCLTAAFPQRKYQLTDDMLKDYEEDVLSLPNVTPNGLILPKRENALAFNQLQKAASASFAKLGFGKNIARVQYPINVRLQNGRPNPAIDTRPRASVKLHSDIWAGDPASAVLCFLCLLGDPLTSSGIRFFRPKQFPKEMVKALENFNEGASVMKYASELPQFDNRGWYLADSYLIHQTTKQGSAARISIDFRIIPSEVLTSDVNEEERRSLYFCSFDEWLKLGEEKLIISEEAIGSFKSANNNDPYTLKGYPARIHLVDAFGQQEMRKAG